MFILACSLIVLCGLFVIFGCYLWTYYKAIRILKKLFREDVVQQVKKEYPWWAPWRLKRKGRK